MIPKIITIDDYYTKQQAKELFSVVSTLNFTIFEFGKQVEDFNLVSDDASELFSNVFKKNLTVDLDRSGTFVFPEPFVHFEQFDSLNKWMFVVAIEQSTFNTFHHQSGATSALEEYKFHYRDFFQWDLKTNIVLDPGQGVLFRPWLFHSFDSGIIQKFMLTEESKD